MLLQKAASDQGLEPGVKGDRVCGIRLEIYLP